MITNIYYSNYYKPYILGESKLKTSSHGLKRKETWGITSSYGEKVVLLNKTLKSDIIDYANGFSRNVTGLKDVANNLIWSMKEFAEDSDKGESFVSVREWLEEDLGAFTEKFNSFSAFASDQQHSVSLTSLLFENNEILSEAYMLEDGILSLNENGKLIVDIERLNTAFTSSGGEHLAKMAISIKAIYNNILEFLEKPLSDHMNFKSLGYYYNYKFGSISDNTFQMIENGMLFDMTI